MNLIVYILTILLCSGALAAPSPEPDDEDIAATLDKILDKLDANAPQDATLPTNPSPRSLPPQSRPRSDHVTNPSSSALLRRAPTDPRELTVENYMFTPIQVFYSVHDPGILRLYVAGEIPINVPQAKRFEKYPMRGVEMAAAFADDMLASLGSRGFRVWQSRPLCGGEINRQATYLTLSAFWETIPHRTADDMRAYRTALMEYVSQSYRPAKYLAVSDAWRVREFRGARGFGGNFDKVFTELRPGARLIRRERKREEAPRKLPLEKCPEPVDFRMMFRRPPVDETEVFYEGRCGE